MKWKWRSGNYLVFMPSQMRRVSTAFLTEKPTPLSVSHNLGFQQLSALLLTNLMEAMAQGRLETIVGLQLLELPGWGYHSGKPPHHISEISLS